MTKTILWVSLVVSFTAPALADVCSTVSSVSVVVGDPAKHITIIDNATCVAIDPTTVTFSPTPTHVSIVADATGFKVTGVDATPGFPGFESVSFRKNQYNPVSVNFASSLPILGTLGATSP